MSTNRIIKNRFTLFISALFPLAIAVAFFAYKGVTNIDDNSTYKTAQWSYSIDEVQFNSGSLAVLTEELYLANLEGEDADRIQQIISQVTVELKAAENTTPQLLTDLLRDISLEHPDNRVRKEAYQAMIIALETEQSSYHEAEVASN